MHPFSLPLYFYFLLLKIKDWATHTKKEGQELMVAQLIFNKK